MLYIANSPFSGKRSIKRSKRRWTDEESDFLRKKFKGYIEGINKSVNQSEFQEAQRKCPTRTLPQNNIKIKQHQGGEINLKFITSYFEKNPFFMLQLTKFGDCIEIAMSIYLLTILFK